MNVTCDSCGAKLGAALAPPREAPLRPWGVFLTSLGITFVLALAGAIADLPTPVAGLAAFYGPLIASWRAASNVVAFAALGAVGAAIALLGVGALASWETTQAVLYAALDAVPRSADYLGHVEGTSPVIAVVFGTVVIAAAVLPAGLIGATVGDVLARKRR